MAASSENLSVVKLLISLDCEPYLECQYGLSILAGAAYGGNYENLRFLLETKPDLEPHRTRDSARAGEGPTALTRAAIHDHADILDLLLEHGKAPTPDMSDPLRPLIEAAADGFSLISEKLRLSMDLDAFSAYGKADDLQELFMISAACGWVSLIEKLLQRGSESYD